jgi:hypothetical protein
MTRSEKQRIHAAALELARLITGLLIMSALVAALPFLFSIR